ncbi:MAG: ABC transporter permease [Aggregatilineales bacterium]
MIGRLPFIHWRFYIEHARRDLTYNGRRTAFALFCVAAGVAAIVALRTLALSIGDTLVENIAGNLHGDMAILPRGDSQFRTGSTDGRNAFSDLALTEIKQWAAAHNVQVTGTIEDSSIQVAAQNGATAGRPQFITSTVIDPAVYPFYQTVTALDPPGLPLSKLFTGGNDVVISDNLAKNQGIKVGDQVHVSRTSDLFTVRGIVSAQVGGFSPITLFFGFAYFDLKSASALQLDPRPDSLYLKIPQGANVDMLAADLKHTVGNVGRIDTTTTTLKRNQQLADILDRFIVSLGLVALLIGGVGIVQTMLVVVRRRTVEIAVMKTIGVKGNQIALAFLVEAVIMGIVGSILGDLLGILFSGAVLSFSQRIWLQTLQWRVYPEALVTGFEFGVIVTAVFGFLPVLNAARVRPAVVLRPNEALPPPSGCAQTLLALLIVVFGVGAIAGNLVGNIWVGVIGVALTLIILGFLIGVLYLLVLVLSKLPSFGSVDLRLALRGIGSHRFRAASTLLALSAGMFALSSITLASFSIPVLLNIGFQNVLGGNVLIFTPIQLLQPLIALRLGTLPGVEHYSQISLFTGQLDSVNGDTQYTKRAPVSGISTFFSTVPTKGEANNAFNPDALTRTAQGTLSGQDVRAKGYAGGTAIAGRTLTAEDAGKPVMVLRQSDFTDALGIKPGDKMTYRFGRSTLVTFTVVGILQAANGTSAIKVESVLGVGSAPINSFPPGANPIGTGTIAQITPDQLNNDLVALSAIPGVFALDVGFIDSLIKKLLDVFTTIPTVVATLSLFAAAVIIANTVSLATLERRREIGIMKAVGLRGWRVLAVMTLENGIVGFIGGLLGVGIGIIGVAIVSSASGVSIIDTVSWGSAVLLLALSLAISLVATWLSAWTAVREKPLNVLRYE